ncbi:MAG: TetR/AcrR family transcriptional regulator [Bacteroidetes bacterium]|nr:TetR/AcrR family transcriptional regulator [Rhodothermia bacterium]MCS7155433.1 TetR/AcrR family transcriptional regulator [Bacteroidota bacterium]MCX7907474.1 TetR/AcrR family transcriptional regulator [Bacteroidota bacterium]MDW8138468.1 TetR/AcrR family transcriptional regulator [Bacteroidota bacterium]MDW8284595.1 TetR/AcrR family transcriptional regulator [Bacteroidota bacterium]
MGRIDDICRVAESLFSERGYHATSVRDIARQLRLQGGSLYAHIASKEDLLWEIVRRAAEQFLQAIDEVLRAEASPVERFRRAFRAHFSLIAQNLAAATVYFHEWRQLSLERRKAILEHRDAYEAAWRKIIQEGIATGLFRPVDPAMAARAVLSVANWFYQWYRPEGPLSAEAIADALSEILLHGLIKESAT